MFEYLLPDGTALPENEVIKLAVQKGLTPDDYVKKNKLTLRPKQKKAEVKKEVVKPTPVAKKEEQIDITVEPGVSDIGAKVSKKEFVFKEEGATPEYKAKKAKDITIKEGEEAKSLIRFQEQKTRLSKAYKNNQNIINNINSKAYNDAQNDLVDEENTTQISDYISTGLEKAGNVAMGIANIVPKTLEALSGDTIDLPSFELYDTEKTKIPFSKYEEAAKEKIKNEKLIAKQNNINFVAPPLIDVQKDLFLQDKVKENKERIINDMFTPGFTGGLTENDKELKEQKEALKVQEIGNIQNITNKQKANTAQSVLYGDTMNYLAEDILKTQQKIKDKTATPDDIAKFKIDLQDYKNNKTQYQDILNENVELDTKKAGVQSNIDLFKLNYNPYSNLINNVGGAAEGMAGGALVSLGKIDKSLGGYENNIFTEVGEKMIQRSEELRMAHRSFEIDKVNSIGDMGMWLGQVIGGLAPYVVGGTTNIAKGVFAAGAAGKKAYAMDEEMAADPTLEYNDLQYTGAMLGYGLGEFYMVGGMNRILKGAKGVVATAGENEVERALLNNGIKSYVNKAISNAPKFLSETNKAGLTGFTVAAIDNITDNVILGKKSDIKEALVDGYKNMALMHTAVAGMGNIFGYAVGKISPDHERLQTSKNLLKISELNDRLLDETLDPTTRKVINDNINSLENANKITLQKSINKIGSYSKGQIRDLLEIEQKKFELKQEAISIAKVPNEQNAGLIEGIKGRFKELNDTRSAIMFDKHNALSYIESTKLDKLNKDAKKSLEYENERAPDEKVKITDETIKDRALQMHLLDDFLKSNLNEKGYNAVTQFGHTKAAEKFGIDTYTNFDALTESFNKAKILSRRVDIAKTAPEVIKARAGLLRKAAESIGLAEKKDIQRFDDTQTAKKWLENNTKLSPAEVNFYINKPLGAAIGSKFTNNGKEILFINDAKSAARGFTTTDQHELFHPILDSMLAKDPKFGEEVGKMLYTHIEEMVGSKAFNATEFKERHDLYKKQFDAGEINGTEYWTEVFPLLSEAIAVKDIKYNETFFTKIKDVVRRLLQDLGWKKIDIKTGQDAFNFVRDYNVGFEKGDLGKAFKRLLTEENITSNIKESKSFDDRLDELDNMLADGSIEYDAYEKKVEELEKEEKALKTVTKIEEVGFKEKTPSKEKYEISDVAKTAKEKLDNIGNNPKGFNVGDENIYKELDKMVKAKSRNWVTSKGTVIDFTNKDKGGLDGFSMEEMVNETRASMIPYIAKFDPSKNNSLYGYINAQYVNRMRQALKSGKVADVIYGESAEEVKGLMSGEETDMNVIEQLPERPTYKTLVEAKVLDQPYIDSVTNKVISTVRTLKTSALEKVSINRTITPFVAEIRDAMGKQADIDFKTAMGGKKNGELRSWLLKHKKAMLENLTTTFLMGKNGDGGFPMAIEKSVNGSWVKYPEWVDKTIDRESVSTDLAGRTSGAELVRRLKNADRLISDADFLSFVIGPDGNPLRGRKEAVAKAMGEEYSFDLIKKDLIEEGPIYEALQKNQTLLTGVAIDNAVTELSRQFDRGNVKFSLFESGLELDLFKEKEESFKKELLNSNVNVRKSFIDTYGNTFGEKTNSIISKLVENTLALLPTKKLDLAEGKLFVTDNIERLLVTDNLNNTNSENFGLDLIGLKGLKYSDKNGKLTYDGISSSNKFSEMITKSLDTELNQEKRNQIIEDQINTFSRTVRAKNGLFKTNRQFWEEMIKPNLNEKDLESFSIKPVQRGEGIFHGAKQITVDFDPTIKASKFSILTNVENVNIQSEKNRELLIKQLDKFIESGDVKSAASYINLSSRDMRSVLKLMGKFKGYEEGVFISDETPVYEHRPPMNEIGNKFIAAVAGEINRSEAIDAINSSETYLISKELNKSINENFKTKGDFLESYTSSLEKLNKNIISVDNVGVARLSLVDKTKLSKDFNEILEENVGVKVDENFSDIVAKRKGAGIGKYRFFVPPSAADLELLTYDFLGYGKAGEKQKEFFNKTLFEPYANGIALIDAAKQSIKTDYKTLLKSYPKVSKELGKLTPDGNFTYDQALRVSMWTGMGLEVPGLLKEDVRKLNDFVNQDAELSAFKAGLIATGRQGNGWVEPSEYWDSETIVSDLHNITEKVGRQKYLIEFKENSEAMFSKENLNKIETVYGSNFRDALEDSIYSMTNGTNREGGAGRINATWLNWINNSTGAIMFWNTRSAVLQTVGAVNYLNWRDNNPLNAAKAFANQPQYWKDFVHIWNSDKMKERRSGLKEDVSSAEIANAAAGSKSKANAVISYLLKKGFLPTQIGDSFAIASGGASFYRNRIDYNLKQGMTEADAESNAWKEFLKVTDQTQQSADPRDISQQQRSAAGRLVLAFQNTPMQQARLVKKAGLDLINNRGDAKTNISKIVYYTAVQNIIFGSLQSALFATIFSSDSDEEKEKKKQTLEDKWLNIGNGIVDTILRGSGMAGAIVATLKNTYLKYNEEHEKGFKGDYAKVLTEAANIAPPLGSKFTKVMGAMKTGDIEKDVIAKRGWSVAQGGRLDLSPSYSVLGQAVEAATNLPMNRFVTKVNNLSEAMDSRNKSWQRIALAIGYSPYVVGAKNEESDIIKAEAKVQRKIEGKEKAIETRRKTKEELRNMPSEERRALREKKREEKRKLREKKRNTYK